MAEDAVEALVRESGELVRVAFHVGDPPRSSLLVPARVSEHLRRHVDGRHTSAEACEQPGVLTLTAGQREHVLPGHVADKFGQDRVVEAYTIRIQSTAVLVRNAVVRSRTTTGHA